MCISKKNWSMQNSTYFLSYPKPFKLWNLNQIMIELKVPMFLIDIGKVWCHWHVAPNVFWQLPYNLDPCAFQKTTPRSLPLLQEITYSTFGCKSIKSKKTLRRIHQLLMLNNFCNISWVHVQQTSCLLARRLAFVWVFYGN